MAGLASDDVTFFSVAGKTALITGASSGSGRIFALRLAKQGANVIVSARRVEKLRTLVEEITAQKGKAQLLELDVSGPESSIDSSIEKAWGFFGGIDILVNNAGIAEGDRIAPTFEKSQEDWDAVMNTNVRGSALVSKSVSKRLIAEKRGGSIINIASCLGLERGHLPSVGIYTTSKAALIHMSKALAFELGPHKIRVNSIAPGVFRSELSEAIWDTIQDQAKTVVPLQRWGEVDPDITSPLLLLASDSGAYITGTTIVVDGGWTLGMKSFIPE